MMEKDENSWRLVVTDYVISHGDTILVYIQLVCIQQEDFHIWGTFSDDIYFGLCIPQK